MRVYLWEGSWMSWTYSHASLELSDGTYISWWPESNDKKAQQKGTKGQGVFDLDSDKQRKGDPDFVLVVDKKLDEGAMKSWWQTFLKDGEYSFWKMNCAEVVIQALKIGMGENASTSWLPQHPVDAGDFVRRNKIGHLEKKKDDCVMM